MANEAVFGSTLAITWPSSSGGTQYRSLPGQVTATLEEMIGPVPGMVTATVAGTTVDLSLLNTPGPCRIMNLDVTNYVTLGIYDGAAYFPLVEVRPGESFVFRLYRFLGSEFTGTGTGTPADVNTLMVKADTAACKVLIEAFNA